MVERESERRPGESELAIRLDQFLKFRGITATGGQAKLRIQGGEVRVNGVVETRRGRRLRVGDVVQLEDGTWRVEPDDVSPRRASAGEVSGGSERPDADDRLDASERPDAGDRPGAG